MSFHFPIERVAQPTKGAGTLRRGVRRQAYDRILGRRHMECAYYLVDGTWECAYYFGLGSLSVA